MVVEYCACLCYMFQWNWLATTLNPYYEGNPLSCMINDDRFILHTLDKWNFGLDYTGDLMNIKNMLHIVKKAAEMGDVLLVRCFVTVMSVCISQTLN